MQYGMIFLWGEAEGGLGPRCSGTMRQRRTPPHSGQGPGARGIAAAGCDGLPTSTASASFTQRSGDAAYR